MWRLCCDVIKSMFNVSKKKRNVEVKKIEKVINFTLLCILLM